MEYIVEKKEASDEIKFLARSIDRIHVSELINELTHFYLLDTFMKAINTLNNDNSFDFTNQIEVKSLEQLIIKFNSDLNGIKINPKITFEDLILQFPQRKKEFVDKYSDLERVNLSKIFDSIINALVAS